jgi:hypothetical protein
MDGYQAVDVEGPGGDITACPDCESPRTLVVRDLDLVAFLCEDCGTCWRIELGYMRRLRDCDPRSSRDDLMGSVSTGPALETR